MNRGKNLNWVTLGCILALGTGCERTAKTTGGSEGVVARVGGESITLEDFEQQINQQNPLVRSRYKSLDQKKNLLDSLVEREAMVLEARRIGLDRDPEVIQGYKKILARQLVNQEFNNKRIKEIEISDADIEKFYQENIDRYQAPDKVRIHFIFLEAPEQDQKRRNEAKSKAAELLNKLKTQPDDRRLFLQMAKEHSDDQATKQAGGDTNFKTRDQLEAAYGNTFAGAAFSLKQANDLADIVADPKGFYLLRLSGKQAAIDLPLERVKGQIRTTLFARARGDAYKAFVEEIKAKANVKVFDELVEKAKVDLAEAPHPPQRPHNLEDPHQHPSGRSQGAAHPHPMLPPSKLKNLKPPLKPAPGGE